jgi:hypothetical protein
VRFGKSKGTEAAGFAWRLFCASGKRCHVIIRWYYVVMVRTRIQLTEEQMRALRRLSAEQGRSVAELVRKGVDHVLQESTREIRVKRFLSAVGKFNTGLGDLARNHDKYLAED